MTTISTGNLSAIVWSAEHKSFPRKSNDNEIKLLNLFISGMSNSKYWWSYRFIV